MLGRGTAAATVFATAACCAVVLLLSAFHPLSSSSSSSSFPSSLVDATRNNSTIATWTEPEPSSLSKKQRTDLFEPHKYNLLICRAVPTQCARQDVLMSAAFMHGSIMNVGSFWLCVLTMLCGAIGIWLSWSPTLVHGDGGENGSAYMDSGKSHLRTQEMAKLSTVRRRNGKEFDEEHQSLLGEQDDNKKKETKPSHLERLMDYWTSAAGGQCRLPPFAHPVISLKLFLVALIWLELQDITAPSQSVLATPEMVWLMAQAPNPAKFVPNLAQLLLLPLMGKSMTIGGLVTKLGQIRGWGLISWLAFLLIPEGRNYSAWAATICYAFGAAAYLFLGSIGLMYKLSHSTQGGLLFVTATTVAIPPLFGIDKGRQVAGSAWLRRFLFLGILIPIYLMSGISKLRYVGILANLNGRWLWELFEPKKRKYASWTFLRDLLYNHKILLAFMSWGNLVLEIFVPLALLLRLESKLLRMSFHGIALAFHISIFFLVGPNFGRYCLLHILACDPPLGWFARKRSSSAIATSDRLSGRSIGDWLRVGVAMVVLVGWFRVQILSDIQHILGQVEHKKKRDPYFPFSEFSMFASAVHPNYMASLLLVLISMGVYCRCFLYRVTCT